MLLQSPDVAKVKEELSRLQKRLKAGTKLVEEKEHIHKEQSQLSDKLQADLEKVTDGKAPSTPTSIQKWNWVHMDDACCLKRWPEQCSAA